MSREQFELSDAQSRLLTQLMKECDLSTKKAVIENALVIFGWAVSEAKRGRTIAAVNEAEKVFRELIVPALEAVREKASEPSQSPGMMQG